jgi:hypothetical protein
LVLVISHAARRALRFRVSRPPRKTVCDPELDQDRQAIGVRQVPKWPTGSVLGPRVWGIPSASGFACDSVLVISRFSRTSEFGVQSQCKGSRRWSSSVALHPGTSSFPPAGNCDPDRTGRLWRRPSSRHYAGQRAVRPERQRGRCLLPGSLRFRHHRLKLDQRRSV